MGLKIQWNDLQWAKIAISYRNTQWPCPKGFHIGSKDEWQSLINYLTALWVYNVSDITTVLNIPSAYYLARSNGSLETRYWIARYWTSTMTSNTVAWAWGIDQNPVIVFQEDKPWNAFSIRPFKDEPVIPDSSWTEFPYWVFKNTTLWLISIQNASNWITISDKNLWATNVWDKGLYYQFWNNHWFTVSPSSYVTSKPTFSDEYWPQNPYNSSQFVRVSSGNNWFNGTCNDIWWWVNPTWSWTQVKDVQEIYIWSTKIRPAMRLVLQWNGWNVYEENGEYIFTDEMWWSVDIVMKVSTSFNTIPTGCHKWYAEEYWFLNQWCQKYWVSWTDFLDLYNIDWNTFGGILTESYTESSWQCIQLWTADWAQFYMRDGWMTWVLGNNYLSFADSNYTNYYKIARPSSYIDASINPWGVYWTPFYAKNNTIRVTSFSCTSQPYRCEATIIFAAFNGIMMNYSVRPETVMLSWWVKATWNNNMAFLSSYYMTDWAIWGNHYQGQIMNYKFSFEMGWHSQSNMWYFPHYEILATDAQSMNPVTVDTWTAYWYNNQYWPVFSNPFIWLPNGYSDSETYTWLVQIL